MYKQVLGKIYVVRLAKCEFVIVGREMWYASMHDSVGMGKYRGPGLRLKDYSAYKLRCCCACMGLIGSHILMTTNDAQFHSINTPPPTQLTASD
jgi:hypothetical protein